MPNIEELIDKIKKESIPLGELSQFVEELIADVKALFEENEELKRGVLPKKRTRPKTHRPTGELRKISDPETLDAIVELWELQSRLLNEQEDLLSK